MSDFEKLMAYFEIRSYGDLIMPSFELVAIIVGLLSVRNQRTGVLFLTYLIFDFFISITDSYLNVFSLLTKSELKLFQGLTNNLIALLELLVYFNYFSKILQ